MPDHIASFPLRSATTEQLSSALGRCYAEYNAWHGQATLIASFAHEARTAGVESLLAERARESLDFGEEEGFIVYPHGKRTSNHDMAQTVASQQLATADYGVKLAAVVMLHNACERFLWRLVRFGLVANRNRALKFVANRQIAVNTLVRKGAQASIDDKIEHWWAKLERDTMLKKWDRLVALVGHPPKLHDVSWHFHRDMLSGFDDVRHNAVHHGGQAVRAFDFAGFAQQLWRAQLVWLRHVTALLKVKIPAGSLFASDQVK
jgi:phage gp16-like protein